MTLYSEITEQPERIKSLLASQKKNVERIASEIQKRDIQYVFLAARGTSDNAGRYANYLLGAKMDFRLHWRPLRFSLITISRRR